jgi:hypothetical protein
MRTISGSQIPKELKNILFELGKSRKLALVEGRDDSAILKEWFEEKSSKLLFFPAGNCDKVKEYLDYILDEPTKRRYFGIIDRDFRYDEEVEFIYNSDYNGNLFIWRKYCIENYLFNEKAILKELDKAYVSGETGHEISSGNEMKEIILQVLVNTKYLMAGNWTIKELGKGQTYIGAGFENDRDKVLGVVKGKLSDVLEEKIEKVFSQKLTVIECSLQNTEDCHKYVNGKYVIPKLMDRFNRLKIQDTYFKMNLAQSIKDRYGLDVDIEYVVNKKILGE